jgi:hypothetical protein
VEPARFVADQIALDGVLLDAKLMSCPHCRVTGMLIGHGLLRGYAERSSELVVRGRRIFCSNRGRKSGCGRTFSVILSTVLSGFVVRTLTLFTFVQAVLTGLSRRAAWLSEVASAFSLSSGYRVWRRLASAQAALRSWLSRQVPAPTCTSHEPLAALLAHLGASLRATDDDAPRDLFATFQRRTGRALLAAHRA